jgi:hypothetical protein
MKVTAESHPTLFVALECISHDNGGQAGHEFYEIPEKKYNETSLTVVEQGLKQLSSDDLETFCIGEYDDAKALAITPELKIADQFLDDFANL